jgi:hypothetical protein
VSHTTYVGIKDRTISFFFREAHCTLFIKTHHLITHSFLQKRVAKTFNAMIAQMQALQSKEVSI